MTALEKIAAITLNWMDWSWDETAKAIQDIHQLATDEISLQRVARNEAIDDCVTVLKLLIREKCGSHTPFYGECQTCRDYDNPDILPPPDEVIQEIEKLK